MNKIIIISLACIGVLVTMPFEANALNSQPINQNLLEKTNLRVAQDRLSYQRGYTVHYRSPRDLEGFHAERPDAESAARRLQRSGFRTQIRSLNELPSTRSRGLLSLVWDSRRSSTCRCDRLVLHQFIYRFTE